MYILSMIWEKHGIYDKGEGDLIGSGGMIPKRTLHHNEWEHTTPRGTL